MGFNDSIEALIKTVRPQSIIEVQLAQADHLAEAESLLAAQPLVESVARMEHAPAELEVTLIEGLHDYSPLATALITAGFAFRRFAEKETNLESAFMGLTKGSGSKI